MQTTLPPIETPLTGNGVSLADTLARLQAVFTPRQELTPSSTKSTPQPCEPQSTAVTPPTNSADTLTPPRENPLKNDPSGQQQLSVMVSQCFQALKLYGKQAESLEAMIQMHQAVLAEYPISKIRQGFTEFLKRGSEIPMPADIVNLIDPLPPKPDWAAYVGIKNKLGSQFVTTREREYLTYCENYAMKNVQAYQDIKQAEQSMQSE